LRNRKEKSMNASNQVRRFLAAINGHDERAKNFR
jgi:hypothetical protein